MAMLSFLKVLQNSPKHGSELGVLLWRHLTLQRKTIIWVHNAYRRSMMQFSPPTETLHCTKALLNRVKKRMML